MSGFGDRLIEATRRHGPLCLGLDPFPERVPPAFARADPLSAISDLCEAALDAADARIGIVKPQLGLFERFGPAGYALCAQLVSEAQARGFLVILDAKRGDIASTAEGYAEACLGEDGFDADCVTVNPWMGLDTIQPFLAIAKARGKGVAVLVRTSNPGAADLQDLVAGDGEPVHAHLARRLNDLAPALAGETGWSGLMAVVGATAPEPARRLRRLMPRVPFLVPGFGAQGADAEAALAGFVPGPAGLEGGVVNSSRALLYPEAAAQAQTVEDWREAAILAIESAKAALRA